MLTSLRRLLGRAGLIAAIILGGLVMGALTPAYSQDEVASPAAATP